MRRFVMRRFALSALFVAVGLAGCGDDAPTMQEFLAKADPVCKHGNELAAVFITPSDMAMIKDFAVKLAGNAEKTASELEKLDFPGGDDGDAATGFVQAMRDGAKSARDVGPEVDKANFPGVEAGVDRMATGFKVADDKARASGSTECGKGEATAAANLKGVAGTVVKAAFIAKADALCATANKELDTLAEPESFEELQQLIDKGVAVSVKLTADLKAIPAPALDKAKLDEALVANDQALAKAKEAQAAVTARDQKRSFALLEEVGALGDAANAKADAYGFKDCGSQG